MTAAAFLLDALLKALLWAAVVLGAVFALAFVALLALLAWLHEPEGHHDLFDSLNERN